MARAKEKIDFKNCIKSLPEAIWVHLSFILTLITIENNRPTEKAAYAIIMAFYSFST